MKILLGSWGHFHSPGCLSPLSFSGTLMQTSRNVVTLPSCQAGGPGPGVGSHWQNYSLPKDEDSSILIWVPQLAQGPSPDPIPSS